MPRIILKPGPLISRELLSLTSALLESRDKAARIKAIMDQITAGGTQTANLETGNPLGTESGFPTATGATLYAATVSIKTALDGLAATLAQIDQG